MCGTRLRQAWLLSAALLLLSSPLFSEDVYEITESELTALERILSEQATTIEKQNETLTKLRGTLTTLNGTIETQERTINELQTSYKASENEARWMVVKVGAVTFTVGAVGGLLFGILQ